MVSFEGVPNDCKLTGIEFSIKTRIWLCIGFYKPPSQNDKYFLDNLSLILNKLTCQVYNIILMGDFNLTVESNNLEVFVSTFDIECLIKKTACFQSAQPKTFQKLKRFRGCKYLIIITASKSQLIKGNAKMK